MAQYTAQTEHREEDVSGIANATPLGLLTLALTTAIVGASFAGFLVPNLPVGLGVLVSSAIFFGGIVQLIAGMWEFRRNNTFAATLFSAYGGFLIVFGILFLPVLGLIPLFGFSIVAFNHTLGLLFLCWTICTGVLLVASLRISPLLTLTLGLLFLAYLFLMIGQLANANGPLLIVGGCFAMLCALVAWYASLTSLLEATHSPFSLPMGGKGYRKHAPLTSPGEYGEPAV